MGFSGALADCITDPRDPSRIQHDVKTLLAQRVCSIAMGYAITAPHRADAVLRVIKGARYSLGETTTVNRNGTTRHVLNAVDARTGESFTVSAGTLCEAAVELAGQLVKT